MALRVYAFCELQGGQWVIRGCPFCFKRHYHGAGGAEDDPRQFLGSRAPHCVDAARRSDEYVLTTDRFLNGRVAE
jgi:hypothetical protein